MADQQTERLINQIDEEQLRKLNLIEDQKFVNVELSRSLDTINQLTQIKKEVPALPKVARERDATVCS